MKIIFFGTSGFGIPSLEALGGSSHQVSLIVTTSDKPKGRHLKSQASAVKTWAAVRGLPCVETSEVKSDAFVKKIESIHADLFVVISFGLILPGKLLALPRLLALNVHPSLLPRYRGAAPMQWALINGDLETGVTVMRMIEKLDAGDILLQRKAAIKPGDDIFSVEENLSRLGAKALLEALEKLEKNTAQFIPQNDDNASFARKLTKEDGRVDWKQNAFKIQNRVKAMKAWPTSYTFYEGRRIILEDVLIDESGRLTGQVPGTILETSKEKGIRVACADTPLIFERLKLEGRKALSACDFLNGFPLKIGKRFE